MITQKEVISNLFYDKDTGYFYWDVEKPKVVKGSRAGCISPKGYRSIKLNGKNYKEHKLAWLYVYGGYPGQIDHINGIKDDNRICNLRIVSSIENSQNRRKARKNSYSGLLGVDYRKECNKYVSSITVNYKRKFLGYFDNAIDAHEAYLKAKRELHSTCTI